MDSITIKKTYIIHIDGVPAGAMYGFNGSPIMRGKRDSVQYIFDKQPNRFNTMKEAKQARLKLFEWLLLREERNYQKWKKSLRIPRKMQLTVPNLSKHP